MPDAGYSTATVVRRLRDAWVGVGEDWKALLVATVVVGLVEAGLSVPA